MKYFFKIILVAFGFVTVLNSCDEPSSMSPTECLEFSPLGYHGDGYNITVYRDGQEISSKGYDYSNLQKEIVLEFNEGGRLVYWFKKDYLTPNDDTVILQDGTKSLSHTIKHSGELQLKHIYTNGTWQINFKDSTVKIDFGKNDFSLIPIEAKYTRLGAGNLDLQQTEYFDSLINGKKETLKKVINAYLESY